MPTIDDVSIIDSNTAEAKRVESGLERTICSPSLCGSKNLTVYRRTISKGRQLAVDAGKSYHIVYVMRGSSSGRVHFKNEAHTAEDGAGVLLVPGETARFDAAGADLELLHTVTPKPPAAVEGELPGGPGYFFNRKKLRALSRGRRVALSPAQGRRREPGWPGSRLHDVQGRGKVDVGETSQEIEPGTLVYFPPGVPHRLNAHGGPLDYFEIQARRSFKTTVLSKEAASGLKWYYEREGANAPLVEWNQS